MTFHSIVFVICIDEVSPFFLCNLFFICGLFSFYILFSLLLVLEVNTIAKKERKKCSVLWVCVQCHCMCCYVYWNGADICQRSHSVYCTDQWWCITIQLHFTEDIYHWQELPQVSFLSWQKFCCDKLTFVMTNMCLLLLNIFCRNKSMLDMTCLSQQTWFCHNKSFVEASILLSCQFFYYFLAANMCLAQQYLCHNKNNTCGCSCQW